VLTKQEISARFLTALERLAELGKNELLAQGHNASGKGIQSIEAAIASGDISDLIGVILANDYLVPVDTGVSPARVPFGGIGGGGTSKYIQGLLNWADYIKPGLSEKEKKSFVFAVAHTHKKEGIPSNGAYSFTSNGRRTGWIEWGMDKNIDSLKIDLMLLELLFDNLETSILPASK